MTAHGDGLEQLDIAYGNTDIRCDVQRIAVRRLRITVFPDQRVYVSAPRGVPLGQVRERVKRRAAWICRQIGHFGRIQPIQPPRCYVGGETHLFLGRQYRLRIVPAKRFMVALEGRHLVVYSRTPKDSSHIRRMVDRWYLRQAHRVLPGRFQQCLQKFSRIHNTTPKLRLRRMKNRWGSCTTTGTITLNRDLVKAPPACMDYAIIHELCHLRELHHGKAFYALLRRLLPDWESRKSRLDSIMAFLP